MTAIMRPVVCVFDLNSSPWKTFDPFLCCAHYLDRYPPGNATTLAPEPRHILGRNIGNDFSHRDGWSMYHGYQVPGFPRRPHRGFETITIIRHGYVDHSDSSGAMARYGAGDTKWLTAGAGIQYAETFPLLNSDGPNPLELFQVWLNLPRRSKMATPNFTMFWASKTPVAHPAHGVTVKVVAGEFEGTKPLPPPKESWAASPESDVAVWLIELAPTARYKFPAAKSDSNRTLYYHEGGAREPLFVNGVAVPCEHGVRVFAEAELMLETRTAQQVQRVLLLQGRPIGEPIAQYGEFVMNTKEEVSTAYEEFALTEFGPWKWSGDAPVHDRQKDRFAQYPDGRIELPSGISCNVSGGSP
jgi:hypothetical protein